jgi:hypothetical protein
MPILYFGKSSQGKVITVQQALKLGIEDKKKSKLFSIPKDYAINKDTKRLIKLKTAIKQLKDKKIQVEDIFFNSKVLKKEVVTVNERNKFIKDIFKKLDHKETFTLNLGKMPVDDIEFLRSLSKYNGRYIIYIDNNNILTLNERNRIQLEELILDKMIHQVEHTSFGEIVSSILKRDSIKFMPVNEQKNQGFIDDDDVPIKIKRKREGAFFKHLNLTEIDLTRYGIHAEINKDNYKDNCLIESLRNGGLDEKKIDSIKSMVKNRSISKCKLNDLCDLIKCRIIIKTDNTNNKKQDTYGKDYQETYNIGCLDNHYFIIEKTNITSYALENYFDLKHFTDFNYIYRKNGDCYRRDKSRVIDSYDVIKILLNNKDKLIREMTIDDINKIGNTPFYDEIKQEIINLEYDEEICLHEIKEKKEKEDTFKNVFFDFETRTTKDNSTHVPYLCRTYDGENHLEFFGENCGYDMLCSLKSNTRLIAHNATYDLNFIFNYLKIKNRLKRGSHLLGATAMFGDYKIEIKDSYNLITEPLRSFKNIFKLDIGKEVMNYDLYNNNELFDKRYLDIDFVLNNYIDKKDHKQFIENIDRWNLRRKDNTYDIIQYSNEYCKIDCKVLYDGYNTFRNWILESFEMDINTILTSASLAHRYFIKDGCYDGVYELAGVPQRFIQGCVVGGRTMVSNNIKDWVDDKIINDFDAVSLYPSAMARLDGFLKGKPKVITNLDYNWLSNQDGYFVDIKINKIGIKRNFSLMSEKNDQGIRIFNNDMENKKIRVDKIALEDLIKFQKIEFEIIRGYYFNEGFNTKINNTIKYLFSERSRYKDMKNPIETIYKLIMNSAYGKTIMKEIDTEDHFINSKKNYDVFLMRNYNCIKDLQIINENKYIVSTYKDISVHKNIPQVGVSVLSMSKRLMNEVMCLAEDEGLKIYYQDTDSMHIDDKDINILEDKFKKLYNRELIGKDMGQFHSDFEFYDEDGNKRKDIKNIVAVESIFLGKKCYIDKLEGQNQIGEKEIDYHVRMKGIPEKVIYYTSDLLGYDNVLEMYKDLYRGEEIEFDLTMSGKRACFKQNKKMTVETLSLFSRKLKF